MIATVDDEVLGPPVGLLSSPDALGVYHLLRPLGEGGMAKVWLAVDSRSGDEVAVKRMLPRFLDEQDHRRAFVNEAQLGLRMRHRNIVDTIELGEITNADGVEPYIVLERLRGHTLIELLRAAAHQHLEIPLGVAIRIVADSARGLHHAHQITDEDGRLLGVVHRDVSPHNLFVCDSGVVKVLDFGIAKAVTQRHKTHSGHIKGKLAYLSPEQIRGQEPDPRIDVFGLGIVLYELFTGKPLFRGDNDAATLHRVLTQDIEPPELVRADVPSGLSAVALRALQRDRDRRLPSAAALADAIEAVADAHQIDTTSAAVRAFSSALFPHDAETLAEDSALARRTYEHLSTSTALPPERNPWVTPAQGTFILPRNRTRRALRSLGFALLGLALVVTAAFCTASLLHQPAWRASDGARPSASASPKPAPRIEVRSLAITPASSPQPPAKPQASTSTHKRGHDHRRQRP